MIVALTIGHAGRPHNPADRGAAYEGVSEVSVVRRYTDLIDAELRRRGHTCYLLSDGAYSDQQARADSYGASVYINCHVNAGGGDRGEVFYDYRSTKGPKLALLIAEALQRRMGWPCFARKCQPDTNGVPRDADYSEAYGCIAGAKAPALCLEPYYLDGPRRADFLARLNDVAVAVVDGLEAWSRAA